MKIGNCCCSHHSAARNINSLWSFLGCANRADTRSCPTSLHAMLSALFDRPALCGSRALTRLMRVQASGVWQGSVEHCPNGQEGLPGASGRSHLSRWQPLAAVGLTGTVEKGREGWGLGCERCASRGRGWDGSGALASCVHAGLPRSDPLCRGVTQSRGSASRGSRASSQRSGMSRRHRCGCSYVLGGSHEPWSSPSFPEGPCESAADASWVGAAELRGRPSCSSVGGGCSRACHCRSCRAQDALFPIPLAAEVRKHQLRKTALAETPTEPNQQRLSASVT